MILAARATMTWMSIIRHDATWERMIRGVEKVRERLQRAVDALEAAGIPYAVVGGHAVAAWVSRVDEAAVRNSRDVDILLRRDDLEAATTALTSAGFIYRKSSGVMMFLDGKGAKARDAVHILLAGEKVLPEYDAPTPDVEPSEPTSAFRVVPLESLVRMALTSSRREDRMHLRDMADVGLIDASWPGRFTPELSARLQSLLDDPDG